MFPNEAVTIEKSLYFKNRIFAKKSQNANLRTAKA